VETIKGTVSKVLFSNEETGYKVIRLRTVSGSPTIMTGEFGPDITLNAVADFHGDFKSHPKYGLFFKVYSYHVTHNVEEVESIRLFIDQIAPNIGPERSRLLADHFGSDLISVLNNEPKRLEEVDGIGKVSAESLISAWTQNKEVWEENRQVYSLRVFLYSLGLKERRVKKVLAHFGGGLEAEEKIRENPYVLSNIEGIGFTTADFVAKKLGIPESEPNRLKAFVLYLLDKICPSNGHLFLKLENIVNLTTQFGKDTKSPFIGKSELSLEDIQPVISGLLSEDRIIVDDGAVYSKAIFKFEEQSASLLVNIMNHPSDLILLNKEAIDSHIENFEKESGFILSDEQKRALYFFIEHKVFIITGAPGTGKTTLLRAIVELAHKMRLRLTCLTPTGISAKKLALTINHDAYTIHRCLGYRGHEWIYNELNPYETDIVIIDEASMIDQEVFYHLLSALKKSVHLVFVGDHDQLPSVGAGNVLKDLIASESVPVVRFDKIFRQDDASDIIKVAHQIKHGNSDLSLFSSDPKADVFFMRMRDVSEMEKVIVSLAQKFKSERRNFQIITPRNDGPLSVDTLNQVLQQVLNPPEEEPQEMNLGRSTIRKGDRIIVRQNDYENEIFNGDIGKVISIDSGKITIEIDERYIDIPIDEIENKIKLAYSITIHKSQGQEYSFVILPFINQFGKNMLQRNLLYTALTRAKEKVIVLGHGSAIERAINNISVTKRNTKLGERIIACLQKKKNPSLPELLTGQVSSPNVLTEKGPCLSEEEKFSLTDTIEN